MKRDLGAWRMNFAVVIELLCFLVDVNLDRGQGDHDNYDNDEEDAICGNDIEY